MRILWQYNIIFLIILQVTIYDLIFILNIIYNQLYLL